MSTSPNQPDFTRDLSKLPEKEALELEYKRLTWPATCFVDHDTRRKAFNTFLDKVTDYEKRTKQPLFSTKELEVLHLE